MRIRQVLDSNDARSDSTKSLEFYSSFVPRQKLDPQKRTLSIVNEANEANEAKNKIHKNNTFPSYDQLHEEEELHNIHAQQVSLTSDAQNSVTSDFATEFELSPVIGVHRQDSLFSQNAMNDQNPWL